MDRELLKNVENDRFAKHSGISITEIAPGYAAAKMEIHDYHLNGLNRVQGSAIFALADYVFAAASNSRGISTVGVNCDITYFQSPKGKCLTAEANEVSSGKTLCSYNIDIFDEDGSLVARMSGNGFRLRK